MTVTLSRVRVSTGYKHQTRVQEWESPMVTFVGLVLLPFFFQLFYSVNIDGNFDH